jgi:hypothetical protein
MNRVARVLAAFASLLLLWGAKRSITITDSKRLQQPLDGECVA